MEHFKRLADVTELREDGTRIRYISYSFPSHVRYNETFQRYDITNMTENVDCFIIRTQTYVDDAKWFRKRFPNKAINADLHSVWLFKQFPVEYYEEENKDAKLKRLMKKECFQEADMNSVFSAIVERFGQPSAEADLE